ncbi:MAG: TIGR03986 family CRISPR-associated RAMP protein [Chloroflexota bacterium]|nr:TIGR03986 family CRISPR-associated RAMP protein [Chloroflexota bacterium]
MAEFYNPYHFVPVTGDNSTSDILKEQLPFSSHIRHDRYCTETVIGKASQPVFSGRMICRLTTEDPVVIGKKRHQDDDNDPSTVDPFQLENGDPIIPGSTSRGLISSIAETASNSALRVLEDKPYSFRGADRKRHPAGTAWEYFTGFSQEKLPMNKTRKRVSLAEQLFGFVELNTEESKDTESNIPALAGRLRFSMAEVVPKSDKKYFSEKTLLKILDSPKPPQPAFYFKNKNGTTNKAIPVGSLTSQQHVPQGRKFYLHRQDGDNEPWKTDPARNSEDDRKQKTWVTPLDEGVSFYFHIDFDNLSEMELSLLCYALRPTDDFRHKLGMGKSLGLGKVLIDPVGFFLIDRLARYEQTNLFAASRYDKAWIKDGEDFSKWPDYRYRREIKEQATVKKDGSYFESLREGFTAQMDQDIRLALELLGDPSKVDKPVRTPQIANPSHEETETFRWFVDNAKKKGGAQYLVPLNQTDGKLHPLSNKWSSGVAHQPASNAGNRAASRQDTIRHRPSRPALQQQSPLSNQSNEMYGLDDLLNKYSQANNKGKKKKRDGNK